MNFDELLSLASSKGPHELEVKSIGGTVYIREPSSADADEWRTWVNRYQNGGQPVFAKLVQLLLCDETGKRIVPQTADGLNKLAAMPTAWIDEISRFCLSLVKEPTQMDLDEEKKD